MTGVLAALMVLSAPAPQASYDELMSAADAAFAADDYAGACADYQAALDVVPQSEAALLGLQRSWIGRAETSAVDDRAAAWESSARAGERLLAINPRHGYASQNLAYARARSAVAPAGHALTVGAGIAVTDIAGASDLTTGLLTSLTASARATWSSGVRLWTGVSLSRFAAANGQNHDQATPVIGAGLSLGAVDIDLGTVLRIADDQAPSGAVLLRVGRRWDDLSAGLRGTLGLWEGGTDGALTLDVAWQLAPAFTVTGWAAAARAYEGEWLAAAGVGATWWAWERVGLVFSGWAGARRRPVDGWGLSLWPGATTERGGGAVGVQWRVSDALELSATGFGTATDDELRIGGALGVAVTF